MEEVRSVVTHPSFPAFDRLLAGYGCSVEYGTHRNLEGDVVNVSVVYLPPGTVQKHHKTDTHDIWYKILFPDGRWLFQVLYRPTGISLIREPRVQEKLDNQQEMYRTIGVIPPTR